MTKLFAIVKQKILEDLRAEDAWIGGYQMGLLTAAAWVGLFDCTNKEILHYSLGAFFGFFLLRIWARSFK